MSSNIEEEFQKALDEREEKNNDCQLMEQFQAEKAQETSKLQLAIVARDTVLVESQRVSRKLCELQQQLESTNAALQD